MPDDYWNREIPVLQKCLLLSAIKIPVTSAQYSRNIMESPLSYADSQTMKLTLLQAPGRHPPSTAVIKYPCVHGIIIYSPQNWGCRTDNEPLPVK